MDIIPDYYNKDENCFGELEYVDIAILTPFWNHTFNVEFDEDMKLLIESIRENGLMEPIIVFINENSFYEIISGHRRVYACKALGYEKIPAIIKYISRDEATIIMGSSNLERRTTILPSEKAATYLAMYNAMKHQGKRTDLYSTVESSGRTDKRLSEIVKDSPRNIHRYMRLNYLIPEILKLVDGGRIRLRPAVEISTLKKESQESLYRLIKETHATPSLSQAIHLKELDREGILTESHIEEVLNTPKGNQKAKFVLPNYIYEKCFSDCNNRLEAEKKLIEAIRLLEIKNKSNPK